MIVRRFVFVIPFVAILALAPAIQASTVVPSNFNEYGTTVNGFQDFFTGNSLANYTEINNSGNTATAGTTGNFTLPGDDTLHINAASVSGDPNKLLYTGATYDASNQNVLAMIKVTGGDDTDGFRGGIAAQSGATSGDGINELFRQSGNGGDPGGFGNHINLLNDALAWGPTVGGANNWTTDTYYWLRETTDSSGNITAKIWAAGAGTEPAADPSNSATWNQSGRSGLAGLVSDSAGGNGTFQVNYLLIQTPDLPPITAGVLAVPEPSTLALGGCGLLVLASAYRRHRRSASVN